VLDVLGYAPGIRQQLLAVELLTPADIEREFGSAAATGIAEPRSTSS
jgi:hypothetical protein